MASNADPIVTRDFSCWPWLHQWQRWIDIGQGELFTGGRNLPDGYYIVQERRCNRCERVQLRNVET